MSEFLDNHWRMQWKQAARSFERYRQIRMKMHRGHKETVELRQALETALDYWSNNLQEKDEEEWERCALVLRTGREGEE